MTKTNWTSSYSSLDLLETLRGDIELLQRVGWDIDESNTNPLLEVIDELKKRLEDLPMPQDKE